MPAMSAIVSPTPTVSPVLPQSQQAGAEASCPIGMLTLFAGALVWLLIASSLGLINSLKFHAPAFLAGHAYLSYGRVHAAQNAAFLYGFGVPAALGLGLWLLCRLGRATLAGPTVVFIGAILWNSAVALGSTAILCGGSTGFDCFEMPAWCGPLLFVAYLMIGVCALLTFHQRQPGPLYPSQWFVAGSLFWFPWIFSTAFLALLCVPSRGVLQASMDWWFARNFDTVFLGFAGLASVFYFIPKLLRRPLHSHYQAALAFWTLALFGSSGGMPDGAPLPSWILSLAVVGTVLTAVPILAVAANFYQTVRQDLHTLDADPTLRFTYVGLIFWIIAGAQQIVGALPSVSTITDFTWFGAAQKELFHYGFFAMTVFGALYYIVPRLLGLGSSAWNPRLLKLHFFFTFFGVLWSYISLLVAGIGQGILLANVGNSFPDVMRRTMMPSRMDTLGALFVVVGIIVFLLNFAGVLYKSFRQCCPERKERP
jgi:cytochrome c oxidase cbb3-type subunit 1